MTQQWIVGTWNMAGGASPRHLALLRDQPTDLWCLTEVAPDLELPGYSLVARTSMPMCNRPEKHFAAIYAKGAASALPQPHFATAAAVVRGLTFWCSVLPWRSAGVPWKGDGQGGKFETAIGELTARLPADLAVWAGDWNQELADAEFPAGCARGRSRVEGFLQMSGLGVVTAEQQHRNGQPTIDHIAVKKGWAAHPLDRLPADGLSDHDAYLVAITPSGE